MVVATEERRKVFMKKLWGKKWLSSLAAFAMVIATVGANTTCTSILHYVLSVQPNLASINSTKYNWFNARSFDRLR